MTALNLQLVSCKTALNPRGRSLIAPPVSSPTCLVLLPCGVTVLSAVGVCRRNIWSEAQALQCPQRAHMEHMRPNGLPRSRPAPSPRRATLTSALTLGWISSRCGQVPDGCSDQRKGSPDRQMLCKITDSFLASATRALPTPD